MPRNQHNKGEWSELYAFIKLLKDGRIYAADENVNRIDNVYLPIIKLIKENDDGDLDYFTGETIKIFADGQELCEIDKAEFAKYGELLFRKIFEGGGNGAFKIPEIVEFLDKIKVSRVSAPGRDKVDLKMQIHDINTGFEPEVGFSIKSDVGSPPTLLNSGKNTRVRYIIEGINDTDMDIINSVTKDTSDEYMKDRMLKLMELATNIKFDKFLSDTYTDNLILIDSALPSIYASLILQHYKHMANKIYDIKELLQYVIDENPVNYSNPNIYIYKIKKLLCASALGMTPGKEWDGLDAATGGYVIIKRDGDVLCYHLYNRNFFETYLLDNTRFDRPSASRYDYFYVYKEDDRYYIDLNVQVRFKSIK